MKMERVRERVRIQGSHSHRAGIAETTIYIITAIDILIAVMCRTGELET